MTGENESEKAGARNVHLIGQRLYSRPCQRPLTKGSVLSLRTISRGADTQLHSPTATIPARSFETEVSQGDVKSGSQPTKFISLEPEWDSRAR